MSQESAYIQLDVIKIFEEVAGKKLKIQFAEARNGDIQESLADITRLKELGFKANWGLENGLREYWEYADGESK